MALPGASSLDAGEPRAAFLHTRVARRLFAVFLLCALVPLLSLALLAYREVSTQLVRQSNERLQREAKLTGMAVYERILVLESDLEMAANAPRAFAAAGDLSRRLAGVVVVARDGRQLPVLGARLDPPTPGPSQTKHLEQDRSLLVTQREGDQVRVFMARRAGRTGVLWAEVSPDFLWVPVAGPNATRIAITDVAGQLLTHNGAHAESPYDLPPPENDTGSFEWRRDESVQIGGYWTLFLEARFGTPNWHVYHSEPSEMILGPLEAFRTTFSLIGLATFLFVALVSQIQIRRILVPVSSLRRAALRIAENQDLSTRVQIDSKDEFRDLGFAFNSMATSLESHVKSLQAAHEVGLALSAETEPAPLLRRIALGALQLTRADGIAIFSGTEEGDDQRLRSLEVRSLGVSRGDLVEDSTGDDDVALRRFEERFIAASSGVLEAGVDLEHVPGSPEPIAAAIRELDVALGVRVLTACVVPLLGPGGARVGAVVLWNATDADGATSAFTRDAADAARSIASQAGVALAKNQLIGRFKHMFEGLIELMVLAIDEKSPYTGGHCRRVPILTMLLADAVDGEEEGPFGSFRLSEDERYELEIAALLHDIGKITTPVHVVDKATKLETIFDRIAVVDTRFEVLARDVRIRALQRRLDGEATERVERDVLEELATLDEEREFLRACNTGGEFMPETLRERVREIGARRLAIGSEGVERPLLSEDELENLSIARGTLNAAEREIINYHVVATRNLLERLPYPKSLAGVPSIAAAHHERVDGRGYPDGLTRDQITIQGRMLGLADVFEALTAPDRPYKDAKPLSEALQIMAALAKEGHIDPDLHAVFVREKVYLRYASDYLSPEQIDVEGDWCPPL